MKKMLIAINENQKWPETGEQKEIAKKISLSPSDEKLGQLLQDKKIIDFRILKDHGLEIKAKQFIGVVNFSTFKLEIIPKIYPNDIPCVWRNLASCINFINDFSLSKIIEYEKNSFENEDQILVDFIIWAFVYECEQLIKRGLLKSYVTHEENLPYLRGKLIIKQQFNNDMRKNVKFFCEFDELEFDNIDNQILLDTLFLCERIAVSKKLKKKLFFLIQQLRILVQKVHITVSDIVKVMSGYNRQNSHYKNAHSLCKLIKENAGITDISYGNLPFAVPFFMDMNKIFEKFVTKLFVDFHDDNVEAQNRQKAWIIDNKKSKNMIPDIILTDKKNKKISAIIDAKYKDELKESDLYQIGFYIHEYRDKENLYDGHEAFAILPKYLPEKKMYQEYTANESKIKIHARYLSIDEYIRLIKNNDINEITERISELISN